MAGCTAGFTLSLERGESTCRGGPLARPDATGSAQDAKASRYDSVKAGPTGKNHVRGGLASKTTV